MRSIHAKILLWTLATFATSLVAFGAISYHLATRSPGPGEFFTRTIAMIEDEAVRSFEEGGAGRLATYLNRLNVYYPAPHHLTDASGRDLVGGEDRSALASKSLDPARPSQAPNGEVFFVRQAGNGRYRFLVVVPTDLDPLGILPYFAAIVLAIGLLGYALAVQYILSTSTTSKAFTWWQFRSILLALAFLHLTYFYWRNITVRGDARYLASAIMAHSMWGVAWVAVTGNLLRKWGNWQAARTRLMLDYASKGDPSKLVEDADLLKNLQPVSNLQTFSASVVAVVSFFGPFLSQFFSE